MASLIPLIGANILRAAAGVKTVPINYLPYAAGATLGAATAAGAIAGATFAGPGAGGYPKKPPGGGTGSTASTRPNTAVSKRPRPYFPGDDTDKKKRRKYFGSGIGRTRKRFDQRRLPWSEGPFWRYGDGPWRYAGGVL